MVLYGGVVDPGYGLERVGSELWQPREDERLHFFLVNISSSDQPLRLGEEKIAALQFFTVDPVPPSERRETQSAVKTWEQYAREPDPWSRRSNSLS